MFDPTLAPPARAPACRGGPPQWPAAARTTVSAVVDVCSASTPYALGCRCHQKET